MTYNEKNTFIENGTLNFNPYKTECGISYNYTTDGYSRDADPTINLSHEMAHAEDWIRGTLDSSIWTNYLGISIPKSEIYACWRENQYRKEIGTNYRTSYVIIRRHEQYFPEMRTLLVTHKGIQPVYNIYNNF